MIFECGTYTGDGTSDRVISLTMSQTPSLVVVKARSARYANYRIGTDTRRMNSGAAGSITAVGAGSFTVGLSNDTNGSAIVYEYYVWHDDSNGDFEVGSYTGDGNATQNISTSFDPVAVWVFGASGNDRSRVSGDSAARSFDASAAAADSITALGTSQFTVGTNLNAGSTTYRYAVWKSVTDKIGIESYSGNGSTSRSLSLTGTTTAIPEFGIIWRTDSSQLVPVRGDQSDSPHGTDASLGWNLNYSATQSDQIRDFGTDSVTIGDDDVVNNAAGSYRMLWMLSNPVGGGGGGGGSTGYEVIQQYYRHLMG